MEDSKVLLLHSPQSTVMDSAEVFHVELIVLQGSLIPVVCRIFQK